MFGIFTRVAVIVVVAAGGWIWGSVSPAPAWLVELVNPRALEQQARAALRGANVDTLQSSLSSEQMDALKQRAIETARASGGLIEMERADPAQLAEVADAIAPMSAAPQPPPGATVTPTAAFEQVLSLCPGMNVQNAPGVDKSRKVTGFQPVVTVQGVKIAANPTRGACLSSGFGTRNGRTHKGVDYHSATGGPILAAGDGTVLEMKYRDDYGNMLLIDHGNGVHTRYAHLASFAPSLKIGAKVTAGESIGLMGNTAGYSIPVHLHYEVLLGDYGNPKGSFGLKPHDPLSGT